jgi:ABC-type nitrate/sulfonate/bicarbonate transport system permease component
MSIQPSQKNWGVQLIFVLLIFCAWLVMTHAFEVSSLLLPQPQQVAKRLIVLLSSGEWVEPFKITFTEVLSAFFLSSSLAIFLGFLLSTNELLIKAFQPLLNAMNAVPAILFFPLYALLFGLDQGSKIALGFTISFFPILLNSISAFTSIADIHLKTARSLGASRWQFFRYVLVPSSIPLIISGLRMGLMLCFLSVLGGETIASYNGLGHQIAESSQAMDSELMYAWIVLIIAISFTLSMTLSQLERIGKR